MSQQTQNKEQNSKGNTVIKNESKQPNQPENKGKAQFEQKNNVDIVTKEEGCCSSHKGTDNKNKAINPSKNFKEAGSASAAK